jgi:LruC domain-containing protein
MKLSRRTRLLAVTATVALAMLGLTGYTTVNNLIIWKYLGESDGIRPYINSTGVPNHSGYTSVYPTSSNSQNPLPVAGLPSDFNARIALMLPEKVDIRNNKNIALSSDDQTNIKLNATAEVWVTFLNEGAGFQNSLGFFTYDLTKPAPTSPTQITNEQIIIPNASIPPLIAASGSTGSTVYLGSFPKDTGIGFFVVANGWSTTGRKINGTNVGGVKEAIDRNWIYYSLKGLNPEPATGNLNQHTVLLNDTELTATDNSGKKYQRLVLGFEDYLRTSSSDHDFNDVLLAVHVSPSSSIGNLVDLPKLVSSTTDPDTDGDGIKDSVDEFPNDVNKAFSRWFPGSSTWGTLAYEDLWPSKGDYDFNDLVVRYRSREVLNASRLVSALEMDLRLDARGGVYRSGFALGLPGIVASNIKSATLQLPDGKGGLAPAQTITPLTGQTSAIFEIFTDAYTYLSAGSGSDQCSIYYNTGTGCTIKANQTFKLIVELVTPTATFPASPYDPFIFRTNETLVDGKYVAGVAKGTEVHLPGRAPSARADTALFRTADDATVLNSSKTYVTTTGLPWALDIPYEWDFPAELVEITGPYPGISEWASSGGTKNTTWYVTPSDRALTFRNGR